MVEALSVYGAEGVITSLLIAFVTGVILVSAGVGYFWPRRTLIERLAPDQPEMAEVEKPVAALIPAETNQFKIFKRYWSVGQSCYLSIAVGGSGLLLTDVGRPVFIISAMLTTAAASLLFLLSSLQNARKRKLSAQFPEALDLLVRGARVGVAPEENIGLIAEELPMPLSRHFSEISEKIGIGLSFEQTLIEASQSVGNREFRYLAATLAIQRKSGGKYADILDNLSKVLRERLEQEEKIQAATSEARLSAKIVGALVLAVCVLLFILNRAQFNFLINDETGFDILLYCVSSLVIGFLMMRWQIGLVK
ncbi:MAG: type II secretion system F family protein [Sneathiella sp.]